MTSSRLEEAWRSERPSLIRAIYLTCGDLDLAAEVVDQAFLSVFARLRSAPVEDVRAYLWRTAFNQSRRSRAAQRRLEAAVDLASRSTRNTIGGLDEHDPHEEVLLSLARLSPQTRVVLVLRYYGDFTNAQIANHQSIPVGTVKSLIHRGLASMRGDLLAPKGCGP